MKKIIALIQSILVNRKMRKEAEFTKELHRQIETLRYHKILEEAEALASRPSYRPAVELKKVA